MAKRVTSVYLDYFLVGHLNSKCFATKPEFIEIFANGLYLSALVLLPTFQKMFEIDKKKLYMSNNKHLRFLSSYIAVFKSSVQDLDSNKCEQKCLKKICEVIFVTRKQKCVIK